MPSSPSTSPVRVARGRLAAAVRHHGDDIAAVDTARRTLRAANLEDHIRRTVAAAPPLTADQRDRLALLLRGGGSDAA